MTPLPKPGSSRKPEAKEKAKPTNGDELQSSKVPVVVPNIDKEIEVLCKHPYELNREVGTVFKAWWNEYSTKLGQDELNQMRTVLKQGVLLPGRRPVMHHHPLRDLSAYEDCWGGCYVFLRCTFDRKDVDGSIFGHRCRERFRYATWMPYPSLLCKKLVRGWRAPPVVKNLNEQSPGLAERPKRKCNEQDRESYKSVDHPSVKRTRLEQKTPGQPEKVGTASGLPIIKVSQSYSTLARGAAVSKPCSVPALTPVPAPSNPESTSPQPKAEAATDGSEEDTDSETGSSSVSDSDTSSVQITNVKEAPGRFKLKKTLNAKHATPANTLPTALNTHHAEVQDTVAGHSRLLKAHAEQMKKVWTKIKKVNYKRGRETKTRANEILTSMKSLKADIDEGVKEMKDLKAQIQQIVRDAQAKDERLEGRLEKNNKALLKLVDDRLSKLRVTL